jgi:hypothetical protein
LNDLNLAWLNVLSNLYQELTVSWVRAAAHLLIFWFHFFIEFRSLLPLFKVFIFLILLDLLLLDWSLLIPIAAVVY